jgi:hypothetical protein
MKSRIAIALVLVGSLNATFGTILQPLDYSKDNLDARLIVQDRAFMKSMRSEYDNLLYRICLFKLDGVTSSFGQKLAKPPDDCVLPLFAENGSARSGYTFSPDKRHTDFNAIGNLGYVEIFYNSDGESIGDAAIYFRADEQFTPLQSTNDYDKRVKWEITKFKAVKKWLDEHLPKVKDLGTVEVTNTPPEIFSAGCNRVNLGGGKICVIQIQPVTRTITQLTEILKYDPQSLTNDNFYVNLYLSPTNSNGHLTDIASHRSHNSVIFAVDGQFYGLTLKHKKY